MRVTLLLPPLTQLNTPYPSVAYLTRALRGAGHQVSLRDMGLELVLRVFSRAGLTQIFEAVAALAEQGELPEPAWRALANRERHINLVEPVVAFLQGRDRGLAWRLVSGLLPLGPRLEAANTDAFGPLDIEDRARYLATLYLEDLADLVAATVDPGFSLARYQAHLALGPVHFGPIAARLAGRTLVDSWLDDLCDSVLEPVLRPDLVGISIPFPGTLYGGLRLGARLKKAGLPVVLGGGYVNTELREVDEPRLWECTDALCFDDGEGPLLAILDQMAGAEDRRHRTRTASGWHQAQVVRPAESAACYADLQVDRYMSVTDTVNPTHRLWSDGRWNKITLAHGCYWKRCAFCDVNLDYISRFEPARVSGLLDQMVELIDSTGARGFHFVDEAAPPRVLRDLALGLLQRNITVSFWGNIRFEKAFTPDLARLLAHAGLIAVTGGLEVASDRLLKLMDKGITVEQAARSAWAFRRAGVMVHAYLMYGFPTETAAETLESMEVVRQMFAADLLSSGFWHRFVLTRHSLVFREPERFKVSYTVPAGVFATNDIPHADPSGADHGRFDAGLVAALDAWMRGDALEQPVTRWFQHKVPQPRVDPRLIVSALPASLPPWADSDRLIWLGGDALDTDDGLVLFGPDGEHLIEADEGAAEWLSEVLEAARPEREEPITAGEARAAFPGSKKVRDRILATARDAGLVGI